jgi:hypothetical protein
MICAEFCDGPGFFGLLGWLVLISYILWVWVPPLMNKEPVVQQPPLFVVTQTQRMQLIRIYNLSACYKYGCNSIYNLSACYKYG